MFNQNSILKEVNIVNKLVCFLLVLIMCLICKEPLFLVFVWLFLLLITKQFSKIFVFSVLGLGLALLSLFFSTDLWISKIFILIVYTLLLRKVTKATELRYVLESTLYRFNNKKITYHILYMIYFSKYFKINIKQVFLLKDDYGISISSSFLVFSIKMVYQKTKRGMKEFMQVNRLRFYNDSNTRTYIDRVAWEPWDTNYMVVHIIILLLTCFYGR